MVSPGQRAGPRAPALFVRRGLLVVALAAALTAVLAGLARLGIVLAWGPAFATAHGPLFVVGVFGTVIALERAVALDAAWGYVAPVAGAACAGLLLTHTGGAPWLALVSALAMVAVDAALVRRQAALHTWLMLGGAVVLAAGGVAWAVGRPVFLVAPAWLAFFVLTISAERLELSRLAPTPRWAKATHATMSLALGVAALLALEWPPAVRALGATLVGLGAWQLRFDLARRTLRQPGLPRFAALGVLGGAMWLTLGGGLLVWFGLPAAGPLYDAALHTVLVGFVLSMVLAHAPIILPAVARLEVPFVRALYLPLAALHLGVALRALGDLTLEPTARRAGSVLTALALGLFALVVLATRAARRGHIRATSAPARRQTSHVAARQTPGNTSNK